MGSFSVISMPSDDGYSGILFGTVKDGEVEAYYQAARSECEGDPQLSLSFSRGRLSNDRTISGTFYYCDSTGMQLSGPYEAKKI